MLTEQTESKSTLEVVHPSPKPNKETFSDGADMMLALNDNSYYNPELGVYVGRYDETGKILVRQISEADFAAAVHAAQDQGYYWQYYASVYPFVTFCYPENLRYCQEKCKLGTWYSVESWIKMLETQQKEK